MTQRIPMRRTASEEIAAVVHWRSGLLFVTGQCYDTSGGRFTY
jgi:hypothetical protein